MWTEYWAHHYHKNPAQEEIEDDDYDKHVEEFLRDDDDQWESVIDDGPDSGQC